MLKERPSFPSLFDTCPCPQKARAHPVPIFDASIGAKLCAISPLVGVMRLAVFLI
jgi:hypothetical protein